ncbi:PREDICTED: pre-mRNA 3' end processing protein WDR33-like [Papilio xuthus]|uniref:Pre-mRNA 3' end processing protein WDR33-like n=1 Tax=Papilio xuthus TaxID=66420 RepID=A0AAJ6Z6A3_PAPXU|nr:PREDICTED: pre-mRNA 3' end processing protein WDR33-like [Papilio xuthus]
MFVILKMWWLCYCAGVIVGAAARSTGNNSWNPMPTFQDTFQPEANSDRDLNDFIPTLNSGMNIHEENNTDDDEEIIPILGSGMNIHKGNDKRETSNLNVDDVNTTTKENDENWSTTMSSLLNNKIEENTETVKDEEVEDEINVEVNVDTAAEVSTVIRRPQITQSNGKIERKGILTIVVNVKSQKEKPEPFEGLKELLEKDQKDYDQKTCDWLNAMLANQNVNNSSALQWITKGPQEPVPTGLPLGPVGTQGPVGQQGPLAPQGPVAPRVPVGPQGPLAPQGFLGPQGPIGWLGPLGLQGTVGPQVPQVYVGMQGPVRLLQPIRAQGLVGPQFPVGLKGAPTEASNKKQPIRNKSNVY